MSAPDWSWLTFDLLAYLSAVALILAAIYFGAMAIERRATEVRPIARWRGIEPGEEVAEYGVGGR